MFQISQLVIYGVHGVCRILQMESRTVDRRNVSYYVLEPIAKPGARYLIPSQNPAALAKIRALLQKEEIMRLWDMKISDDQWIQNENRRKQTYREIMSHCDAERMLQMLCLIDRHRCVREATGRRIHICDEAFVRDAGHVLSGEISAVLQLSIEEAASLLQKKIEENNKGAC